MSRIDRHGALNKASTTMRNRVLTNVCGKDIEVNGRLVRIAHLDGEKYVFPDDPEAMVAGLRKSGRRVDLFTFLQKASDTTPRHPFHVEWDNLAVLPVTTFDEWWTQQLRVVTRNRARKAEKIGVVLREAPFGEELLQGICEIYNESPIRHGKRFPHYGMTLDAAREYAGTFPDQSIFLGAFFENRMIGFIKLVTDKDRSQACIVHILSMLRHRDKSPTNALVAQAVRSCATRGIKNLIYEHFSYGNKVEDSLSHFKEVNGFRRVDIPRYYVPLTPIGRVALRLGLQHRFIDRFPEPVLSKLREWRAAWYSRKCQASPAAL